MSCPDGHGQHASCYKTGISHAAPGFSGGAAAASAAAGVTRGRRARFDGTGDTGHRPCLVVHGTFRS